MPVISQPSYPKPPFYYGNGVWQTVLSHVARKLVRVNYERERVELPDGDFLDLDWLRQDSDKMILIIHGLEGHSKRGYVKASAKYFFEKGWDVLAFNCRSCSGEINRTKKLYHHGDASDLRYVLQNLFDEKRYRQIALLGNSMGGSIVMRYMGEEGAAIHESILGGVAISVPCDLTDSVVTIDEPRNWMFRKRFLKMLTDKMKAKEKQFPGTFDFSKLKEVKCWEDFDDFFSAPANGFASAKDFYIKASCLPYLKYIQKPALILNAKNDPILKGKCYPYEEVKSMHQVWLETPEHGGHVGFSEGSLLSSWADRRALSFFEEKAIL